MRSTWYKNIKIEAGLISSHHVYDDTVKLYTYTAVSPFNGAIIPVWCYGATVRYTSYTAVYGVPGIYKVRYGSCRYNERQLIHVTVVRRVRPRAERWCDCEGHRRWKRAGRTLFCNWIGRASAAEWDFIGYPRRRWRRPCPCTLPSCSVLTLQA